MEPVSPSEQPRRLWRLARLDLILGLLISLAALLTFASLADEVWEGESLAFDAQMIAAVRGLASDGLTAVMRPLTMLGDWRVLTLIGVVFAVVWWRGGHRGRALILALAGLGGALLDQALKLFFHRARPETAGEILSVQGYSFPSGHAMMSLCFYGMLIYLLVYQRSRAVQMLGLVAAVLLIGGIGLSRVYLGVHYPSDILGGFTAGLIWLVAVILGYRDYHRARVTPAPA